MGFRFQHPLQPQQGPLAQRSSKKPPSESPHQAQAAFPSPNSFGQAPTEAYYGPFSTAELGDPMAAAQHVQNRSYQMYHTPQSNSPASVASSQGHDQHARMYSQPPAPMPHNMYYQQPPMAYGQSPYAQHATQPLPHHQQHPQMTNLHHGIATQANLPQMPHQQAPVRPQGVTNSPRPQAKIEPGMPRSMEAGVPQRTTTAPTSSQPNTPSGPAQNGNANHQLQPPGPSINPNAAPGPIPATTPLVVRQDNNGVQWIAFEYSRDRVKMEYTIRCDVESVNVESLDGAFKEENCVYPRACGPKESYRGNRLVYETECNTVGWALAELNPCLRGKRGLIQRAVDSWRNSNSDSKLRSRRVRRMNKMNTRKQSQAAPPNHMAGPRDVGAPLPPQQQTPTSTTPMGPQMPQQRPNPPGMSIAGPTQMHQTHLNHAGSAPDDRLVNGDYKPQPSATAGGPQQMRQAHVFPGYGGYPAHPNASMPSVTPQIHDGIDNRHLPPHPATTIPASTSGHPIATSVIPPGANLSPSMSSPDKKPGQSTLPEVEPRKRKFILVEDTERNNRVRVKVNLEGVEIAEIPDSYRDANSVYPRSYLPAQMQLSPRSKGERRHRGRFPANEEDESELGFERRCAVKVPVIENEEIDLPVPRLSNLVGRKEAKLNDLGYRMSWSQSRVFAGRVIFLQRSLNAYRNKMKGTFASPRDEISTELPPLFETRPGKKRWVEETVIDEPMATPRGKPSKR